jgi:Fe-S cluster assembly scaffold protein SufB
LPASVSEAIDFAATPRVFESVLRELAVHGASSGGVVAPDERRAAFAAFAKLARRVPEYPPRWRHRDALRRFDDLVWATGYVPLPPRRTGAVGLAPVREAPGPDGAPSALAVANAGGLVHLGSTVLVSPDAQNDPRFELSSLADAARKRPKRVAALHGRLVRPTADAYTALSYAFQNCGAYVDIAENAALDAPLQLVWMPQPGIANAVFPHVVVRVRAGARATIVERHLGESDAFVSGIVEIDVAPGAQLDYVVLSRLDGGIRTSFVRAARVGEGGTLAWHVAELGAALGRTIIRTRLVGSGAAAQCNALHFTRGFEHVDARYEMTHATAQTRGRTIVRAAAIDRAQVRLAGNVRVLPRAVGSNASFRQDALDLARDAYVYGRPTLEIGAHDVHVSNASAIGGLDEDALFYAQQRGIARGAAAKMIALAFFEPALSGFPGDALRDEIRTALDEGLDEVGDTFET